jgi:ABC-type transport system involved in cytochrome c biogenesis permease component
LFLLFATGRTNRFWRAEPLSARQLQRRQTWLAPRFALTFFAKRRSDWLKRNPLAWLQQSSVWIRVSKLGWCALILLVDSLVVMQAHPWEFFETAQSWLALLLSVHMTLSAVMIFRQAKETGVLELLLVSPLSISKILLHQLSAFWRRFFLPCLLFAGLAELIAFLDMANIPQTSIRTFVFLTFLTTPFIGSFAALRFHSFAAAVVLAGFFSLLLPLVGPELGPHVLEVLAMLDLANPPAPNGDSPLASALTYAPQIVMAGVSWSAIQHNLARRAFAINSVF